MPTLIKRYANRKLYNTATSRYITLKGIAELLDRGEEVRVVDNETGEDITKVALSQILVDTERSNTDAPDGLLSQILGRGGDALYDALRKGVDDASGNFEEMQERLRRFVARDERRHASDRDDEGPRERERDRPRWADWKAYASPDVDQMVQNAVERVFKVLDLPRRTDIEALNDNLRRVARALERLEEADDETDAGPGAGAPRRLKALSGPQVQAELRRARPRASSARMRERRRSFIRDTYSSSPAAVASTPARSSGSPISMFHFAGSGSAPSGPSAGNVGVIGTNGSPVADPATRDL